MALRARMRGHNPNASSGSHTVAPALLTCIRPESAPTRALDEVTVNPNVPSGAHTIVVGNGFLGDMFLYEPKRNTS